MPRSKTATTDEIEAAVLADFADIRDALLSRDAEKNIQSCMAFLAWQWHFWKSMLRRRKTMSRKELKKLFTPDSSRVAEMCRGLRLTVRDVRALSEIFRAFAAAVSSKKPELSVSVLNLLTRLAEPRQPQMRKLKNVYVEAFRQLTEAQARGRAVTAAALARKLMPAAYDKNPESAVRSMQRGLARVRREHIRAIQLGIPSPYVRGDRQNPT